MKYLSLLGLAVLLLPAHGRAGEKSEGLVAAVESEAGRTRLRHLAGLGIDRWHAAGSRGRGVTVAVLDSGFRGWRTHLGAALPADTIAKSFRFDGNLEAKDSQHGILCGEVVHALAPEAKLLLVNWEADAPAQFLKAVAWAKEQGAKVITCSVIMPCWGDGEGGGPIHDELAKLTGDGSKPGDILFVACAGNIAQRHWSGPFNAGADGYHLWRPDVRDNAVTAWGDEMVSIEVCHPAGSEYAVTVTDYYTGKAIPPVTPTGAVAGCCNVARFLPEGRGRYNLRVKHVSGPAGQFHVAVLGGWLDQNSAKGSISFPADGKWVVAVGAVDATGRRANYSSYGPNSSTPKPEVVAPVPFPSLWRAMPFGGTSAAAPQAAAGAALVWAEHPEWTGVEVRGELRRAAGASKHDPELGYGRLTLPQLGAVSVKAAAAPGKK